MEDDFLDKVVDAVESDKLPKEILLILTVLTLINYKNVDFLRGFITERGKILPARISGNSVRYQRAVAGEIKKARIMALLPFTATGY